MAFSGYEYGSSGIGGTSWFNPMAMDALGTGAGGGFLNSESKSAEKKGSKDRQSLLPVSVQQLQAAASEGDGFKIDDADIFTVKIIGLIESIEAHSTNINYKINDGTGSFECKLWIDKDSSGSQKYAQCKEHSFVRVVGNLREYEGRRHLLVYDMSVINDWNELTHHLLEIMFIHLQNTRGPIPGSNSAASKGASFPQGQGTPSRAGPAVASNFGMPISRQPAGQESRKGNAQFVLLAINRERGTGSHGVSLTDLKNACHEKGFPMTEAEFRAAMLKLVDDGLAYETVDGYVDFMENALEDA